jgi:hypothetical protein
LQRLDDHLRAKDVERRCGLDASGRRADGERDEHRGVGRPAFVAVDAAAVSVGEHPDRPPARSQRQGLRSVRPVLSPGGCGVNDGSTIGPMQLDDEARWHLARVVALIAHPDERTRHGTGEVLGSDGEGKLVDAATSAAGGRPVSAGTADEKHTQRPAGGEPPQVVRHPRECHGPSISSIVRFAVRARQPDPRAGSICRR